MTLHDTIAADASGVFSNPDDFAEPVIYHPHRFYGEAVRPSRQFNAVVERQQVALLGEDGDTIAPMFVVHAPNHLVFGITSEELDTGGDMIELPPRDGKPAEVRSITQLVTQDHGMLVLECR